MCSISLKSQVKVLVELRRVCDISMILQYQNIKYLHSFQQVEASSSVAELVSIQEQSRRLMLLLLSALLLSATPLSLAMHVLAQLLQIQVGQV